MKRWIITLLLVLPALAIELTRLLDDIWLYMEKKIISGVGGD